MIDDLQDAIRINFPLIMPMLFIVMILIGNGLLLIQQVLPNWRMHQELVQQVIEGQTTINNVQVEQLQGEEIVILNSQIEREQNNLVDKVEPFLAPSQADGMLDLLYVYAAISDVDITNLQAQQPTQPATNPVYEVRLYRFQVTGPVFNLLTFVMRIKEASAHSVIIDNLVISEDANGQSVLTSDLLLYLSPLASGNALGHLPELSIPTPMAPTAIPSATPEPTLTITPTPGPSASLNQAPTAGVENDMQLVGSDLGGGIECPGALPSIFHAGDYAVVDFNELGALRMMTEIAGSAGQTVAQVYDNQQIQLLEGPVCGVAGNSSLWYWYASYDHYRGWVAEGTAATRWLCPVENPECA